MSTPSREAAAEARRELEELFPGALALLLVPLCQAGAAHTHREKIAAEWREVPCKFPGKRALGGRWNEKATERYAAGRGRDQHLAAIAKHFARGGNVGWAVASEAIVLDCDSADAVAWVDRALPDAPMQRTSSGAHFVVARPAGVDIRAKARVEILEEIRVDVRVGGESQIVTEPSIHASGVAYSWTRPLPADLKDLPPCPPLILEAIRTPEGGSKPGQRGGLDVPRFADGSRNDSLYRFGCRLRRNRLSEGEILHSLLSLNEERCEPPLDRSEVESIAASCSRHAPAAKKEAAEEVSAQIGPKPQGRLFPLIAFDQIHPALDEDYLVKGILARGAFAALIGAPGTSKTFVALELALSIASCTPWRGMRTRRGRVVYIAAEGAHGLRNRLTAARRRVALGDPASVELYLVPEVVRLVDDADDVERLLATIQAALPDGRADLVVIDTLSRAIAGRDENSAQDMTTAVAEADRLRAALGAAVLLVHHSGKDETRGARGHSSLRAALDTELEVRKLGDSFALTLTKAREHESGRVFHHRLEPVEIGVDQDGDPITSCIVRPIGEGETPQSVDLNVNEQRTHEAIRALLGGSAGTSFEAPEAVLTADLHQWVEQNCKVPRDLRRGVVRKGLDGLKKKGLVATEGKRVFLLAGES